MSQNNIDTNKYNLDLVVRWIQFADSKASFLLTISLALFGISFALIPEAARIVCLLYAKGQDWCLLSLLIALLFLLYFIFGLLGIARVIQAVRPRLTSETGRMSLFFFWTIPSMEKEKFINKMLNIEPQQTANELADQTYECAKVAAKKYQDISIALTRLCGAFILGLFFVILTGIMSGLFPKPSV